MEPRIDRNPQTTNENNPHRNHNHQYTTKATIMCLKKTLIPRDYVQAVLDNIRDVDNPAQDLPADADVHADALGLMPLGGDFIEDEADELGRRSRLLNIGVPGALVDEIDAPSPVWEYEEIFVRFLERRYDRPFFDPCEAVKAFVSDWYDETQEILEPAVELGRRPDLETFGHLVRHHLPQKLDFDSWIGRIAISKLQTTKNLDKGQLQAWQPWMGTHEARRSTVVPKGFEQHKHHLPFLGVGGDGMLTWRMCPWGVPIYTEDATIYADVLTGIAKTEDTLVRLSIRIANWVAYWIVEDHAHVMRHRRHRADLTGVDLVDAVIAILGDDWFDLPFDHEGKLELWKFQRSLAMSEEQYYHSMVL